MFASVFTCRVRTKSSVCFAVNLPICLSSSSRNLPSAALCHSVTARCSSEAKAASTARAWAKNTELPGTAVVSLRCSEPGRLGGAKPRRPASDGAEGSRPPVSSSSKEPAGSAVSSSSAAGGACPSGSSSSGEALPSSSSSPGDASPNLGRRLRVMPGRITRPLIKTVSSSSSDGTPPSSPVMSTPLASRESGSWCLVDVCERPNRTGGASCCWEPQEEE
mmetsp:Transcript_119464/g.372174  ORF Transcript_119464/g.372174 Transcript_119464/m.372174 type:complete len:220 (+) Transcript_119464:614-1273(+)